MAASVSVHVSDRDRSQLEACFRAGKTEQRLVQRIAIVLALADGLNVKTAASCCGCNVNTVRFWSDRWVREGFGAMLLN